MPVDLVTDWRHEAKTLIMAGLGIRETARKLGESEDKVRKWAERQGLAKLRRQTVATLERLSPTVAKTTAGDVLLAEITEKGQRGRLAAAHIGCGVLEEIATKPAMKALYLMEEANGAGRLMQTANVPGWQRQQQAGAGVNLLVHGNAQVLIQGPTAPE